MHQKINIYISLAIMFGIFFIVPVAFAGGAGNQTLGPWSCDLLAWSRPVMVGIATVIFIIAGITYMTSAGNPNRVSFAKKLITGAISALLVLFLGVYFLENVVGVNISC